MTAPEPDRSRLIRVSRDPTSPFSSHAAARAVHRGDFERIRRGIIAPTPTPLELIERFERWEETRKRYLDRVGAVAETRRGQIVVSGLAALAVWNLSFVGAWPDFVELLEPPGSARRTKRGVVVHRADFDDDEIVPWGGHFVTTPVRTIADLARAGHFNAAVVALDHALSPRATPSQQVGKEAMTAQIDRHAASPGTARARVAVGFADGRAGSGGESLSRIDIHRMGFEPPELQVRHPHPDGYYDVDFMWPKTSSRPPTIGEFDGAMKYLRAELRGGRDAGELVVAEKRREDFLRGLGNGFLRWGWTEARRPVPLLRRKLLQAGIRIVRRPQL